MEQQEYAHLCLFARNEDPSGSPIILPNAAETQNQHVELPHRDAVLQMWIQKNIPNSPDQAGVITAPILMDDLEGTEVAEFEFEVDQFAQSFDKPINLARRQIDKWQVARAEAVFRGEPLYLFNQELSLHLPHLALSTRYAIGARVTYGSGAGNFQYVGTLVKTPETES